MNELLKRKRELNEELEKLDKELAKLEQEKFRKKIGKYFRFNLESRYKGYQKHCGGLLQREQGCFSQENAFSTPRSHCKRGAHASRTP